MEIESRIIRRLPLCGDCRKKARPGSEPSCIFKREVLTLIDQLQYGIVRPQDGRSRLSVLSQSANRRGCPNIARIRNSLDRKVDPTLANRSQPF